MDDQRANALIAEMMGKTDEAYCHAGNKRCDDTCDMWKGGKPVCWTKPVMRPIDYCTRPDLLAGVMAAFLRHPESFDIHVEYDGAEFGAIAFMCDTNRGCAKHKDFTRAVCHAIAAALEGEADGAV